MNPGTEQRQRLLDALRPGYVVPDELTLADRLKATLAFATQVAMASREPPHPVTWGEALARDEAILLADIAAFPIEKHQATFLAELNTAPLFRLMQLLRDLATRMNRWLMLLQLHTTPEAQSLILVMETEIRSRLSVPFRRCLRRYGSALISEDVDAASSLYAFWSVTVEDSAGDAGPEAWSDRERFRNMFQTFAEAIARLRPLALRYLEASLRSQRHDPSMGLLLAFLQLQVLCQAPLNRFADRLAEFYHNEVLRMKPRAAALDQVHLLCRYEPRQAETLLIEAGTRFIGGKDASGAALEFASDFPVSVSNTRVAALCTLRLERDDLISPEHELGFATRAKAQQIPLLAPDAADGPQPDWWPLFGGQTKVSADLQDARFGLAISSPLFEMTEGAREIVLTFRTAHPEDTDAHLQVKLRIPPGSRDLGWLTQVFAAYERLEGPGATEASTDSWAREAMARDPGRLGQGRQYLSYLVARCLQIRKGDLLRDQVGRVLIAWLTSPDETLLEADVDALRKHVREVLDLKEQVHADVDDPLSFLYGAFQPDRLLIFDRIFRGLFQARVSIATGWLDLNEVFVLRQTVATGAQVPSGLQFTMRLNPEDPPICPCRPEVHGGQWPGHALLQMVMRTQTRVFGYSLLQRLDWRELDVSVAVRGLRDVVVYNQVGRLDPSKPFQPFGPMPKVGNYLVLGSAELATKPVKAVQVAMDWGQLPTSQGGFPEHYRGYPGSWEAHGFKVQLGLLRDGQWWTGQSAPMPLFTQRSDGKRLHSWIALQLDAQDLLRYFRVDAAPGAGEAFGFDLGSRNGFFKFTLVEPAAAFGHAMYGRLLTDALTRNARSKQPALLPQDPYTPVAERVAVNYVAGQALPLGLEAGGTVPADKRCDQTHRVFHLHPFGQEEILPGSRPSLIPRLEHDGNLYIGLEARDPGGPLSLLFHLRREAASEPWEQDRPATSWSAWCGSGWTELAPTRVLSDSTRGFLQTGIVVLDLPDDLSLDCPRLQMGLYWLRLSVDRGFKLFAGLHGVHAHALRATRVRPPGDGDATDPVPPGTIQAPLRSCAGLMGVQQVGASFGLRPKDTPETVRVRTSERIRHRGRATTLWDYERLLLDAFPEVFKVKCIPGMGVPDGDPRQAGIRPQPGHVLVVVIPSPKKGELFQSTEAPRLDAATLEEMTRFLQERASPSACVRVRNVAYDRIQVRCTVKIRKGSHAGSCLRTLNEAVVKFLSPWHGEGYNARFDWVVRAEDLEAQLRSLDCVEAVGSVSLLHISCSDQGAFALTDTALQHPAKGSSEWGTAPVTPATPWSLALPMATHLFDLVEEPGHDQPLATGISYLEIGNSFIIRRSHHDQ